jgi:hypothetical protein
LRATEFPQVVGSPMNDPQEIRWPSPWQPVADEHVALAFGRAMNGNVRPSIIAELNREICQTHPLYGVTCRPLAYDAKVRKDFLLQTDRPDMPFVMVHFTWTVETDPRWPFVIGFESIDEFIAWARRQPDHIASLPFWQRVIHALIGERK